MTKEINETVTAIYTVIKTFLNVKVSVPVISASYNSKNGPKDLWRVGVFNRKTKQITTLGTGTKAVQAGLSYKVSTDEEVYYQVGYNLNGIVVNKSYYRLKPQDFGRHINCKLQIKVKDTGNKKYTELSLTRSDGRWDKVFKIGAASPKAPHRFKIENSKDYINIISLIP